MGRFIKKYHYINCDIYIYAYIINVFQLNFWNRLLFECYIYPINYIHIEDIFGQERMFASVVIHMFQLLVGLSYHFMMNKAYLLLILHHKMT